VLRHELSDLGGVAMCDRRASAEREQFEIGVSLETDAAIGKTSGKVATLADFETKLFVVVLGLGKVTDSNTDVIDTPPLPDKSLGWSGRAGVAALTTALIVMP
jgi:hypothetical protein